MEMEENLVIIVGAGPAGLATAGCLSQLSVPYIILERDDCFASIWKKKAYDRLHLNSPKRLSELPHVPFPTTYPTYMSRKQFIQYLDDYVSHFKINPMYQRLVEFAIYDESTKKWNVKARNVESKEIEEYSGKFLVVATGEMSDPFVPNVKGLGNFKGEIIHSTRYKSGEIYRGKNVLVVGSGNSGMEIALDLSNYGAKTSIVVRSPIHILSREMTYMGYALLKYIPIYLVDLLVLILSKLKYGDLTKYGMKRPQEGPFSLTVKYLKFPVIDTGTCMKIKSGEIQVLPAITCIKNQEVVFESGKSHPFDVIVFATGFRRSTKKWLKGDDYLLDDDGLPKPSFPDHWKGVNGLYCVGFSRKLGLRGIAIDAEKTANDIKTML